MKTSVELAVSGIQALHLQRRGRGSHWAKAKPSYVDESLFGRPVGRKMEEVEFDPPWVDTKTVPRRPFWWRPEATRCENSPSKPQTPSSTSRKKNKYRLKSHLPSYCDETLFGSKPVRQEWATTWMLKEDVAKLRPLLLTPPSAPRDRRALSSQPKEAPLRAVHRGAPHAWGTERFDPQYRRENSFRKPPETRADSDSRGQARSQSLTRIGPSNLDRFQLDRSNPRISRQQDGRVAVTPTGSLSRPCSMGTSTFSSSRVQKTASACIPRPPWK